MNGMDDIGEQGTELYCHHGVSVKSQNTGDDLHCCGTLSIVQYGSVKYIEWKSTEVNVDSDTQDQEWAVVSASGSSRHQSNSDGSRNEPVRLNTVNVKSFRLSRHRRGHHLIITCRGGPRSGLTFVFQNSSGEYFVTALLGFLKVQRSKRDRNLYFMVEDGTPAAQELHRSFAELELFTETPNYAMWSLVNQFRQRPYETTLVAFSKITDALLFRSLEQEEEHVAELLNQSLSLEEETVVTNVSGEEYEIINSKTPPISLPSPPAVSRSPPLSVELWSKAMDADGKITDPCTIKKIIFHGGVVPVLRYEVWKFLLGYYPWNSTNADRAIIRKSKVAEYYRMKEQWKSMSPAQEERFSDFRDRKSLIEKDVKRTDRALPFYAGDDNQNVELLHNILMTYVMYNFDLGYVQGMSDLLSPILQLMSNEADAFWCFVGFMERTCTNFDMDQAGMKLQLQQLHTLLSVLDPQLTKYLDQHESGNMFFCFRWLLVLFKREFSQEEILHLWEVLWSDLPCPNFHLLFCTAILSTEKVTLYSNNYGFTEILKHVNELSLCIDMESTLCKAEAFYEQLIRVASSLPKPVRSIIGLDPPHTSESDSENEDFLDEDVRERKAEQDSSIESVALGPGSEAAYERSIGMGYL